VVAPDDPTEPTPGDPAAPCEEDGEQNPPSQTSTAIAKLIKEFCSNMTASLKSKVEVALNEYIFDTDMPERGCIQKFIYNSLINVPFQNKFSICMDSNSQVGGTFNAATLTITFRDEYSIDSRILGEEMFHAFQNITHDGGISQYGSVGFYNIEFEHALFRDITVGSDNASAMGRGDQALIDEYASWIISLTQNNTQFPTSLTVAQEAKYFYFLDKFEVLYPKPNASINPSLKPKAMLEVFQRNLNCRN
jgi:hypothetical protein